MWTDFNHPGGFGRRWRYRDTQLARLSCWDFQPPRASAAVGTAHKGTITLEWRGRNGSRMVLPWHLESTGRDGWQLVLADGPDSQCLRQCVLLVADPVANGPARRWWFACPDCQRRCGRIWLIPNPWMFVCRACGSVTYASRQRIHPRRQEAQLLRFLAPWVPAG